MQSASYNHSHCYHADTTDLLLLLSDTMPPFLTTCGLTIVFLNLPCCGSRFWEPLSFHYLTTLAKKHKMAVSAERWKAESGSHFITQLDPDKRTTHDALDNEDLKGEYSAKRTVLSASFLVKNIALFMKF